MLYLNVSFNITREVLFIVPAITIIIFSFIIRSNINTLRDLKVKTHFTVEYENYKILNVIKNEYEEFFKKYDLSEGKNFSDCKEIEKYFAHIYRASLALIIILIILIILSVISFIFSFYIKDSAMDYGSSYVSLVFFIVSTIRVIIIFILFWIYFSFFIIYKNYFENGFFELYDNINNNDVKIRFENYYISFFDLRSNLLVNIILQSINISIGIIYIILYFISLYCNI